MDPPASTASRSTSRQTRCSASSASPAPARASPCSPSWDCCQPGADHGGQDRLRGRRHRRPVVRGDAQRSAASEMSMIFQDPMTSLNPVLRIGSQIAEADSRSTTLHCRRRRIRDRVVELLDLVGIPDAERARPTSIRNEFSGGMRQRAMIAMAIANDPALLIADEPTTALDVTIQAQVMEVLADVRGPDRRRHGPDHARPRPGRRVRGSRRGDVWRPHRGRERGANGLLGIRAIPTRSACSPACRASTAGAPSSIRFPVRCRISRNRPSGCVFHPRCGLGVASERPAARALPELSPIGRQPSRGLPLLPRRPAPGRGASATPSQRDRRGRSGAGRNGRSGDAAGRRSAQGLQDPPSAGAGAATELSAVSDVSFELKQGRDARTGRRIRLRQVDARPRDSRAASMPPAARSCSRATNLRHEARAAAAAAPRDAGGVPGPLRVARSAHDDRTRSSPSRCASTAHVPAGARDRAARPGRPRPGSRARRPASFPAASASASPSRARWRSVRIS